MGLIPRRRGGPRRRRRSSLNGLAIQLSAFALSFTLVALLVVSGSQAAFVETSEVFADYVPIGAAGPTAGGARKPARPAPPAAPAPLSPAPGTPAPEPVGKPVERPVVEPAEQPALVVALSDSDEGTAMFAGGTPLSPGASTGRCIEVTYTGEGEEMSPVLLYAAATSGDLAPYLDLTIDIGPAGNGTFGNCADFTASGTLFQGTLAEFAATHSSYATGRPTWRPSAAEETRAFRFQVAVQDVPAAAGRSVSFGFTWRTEAA